MTQKIFSVKKNDLKGHKDYYKALKAATKFAEVGFLNGLAFKTRGNIMAELDRHMTIRSPSFVRGSVRFQKATIKNPVSEAGSIKRERFTGWEEQETGKKTARTRVQTRLARSNDWKRRVAPRFRLKLSNKFIRPSDFKLKKTDIVPFLQILDGKKWRHPYFVPTRYKRMQRGVYIFVARKIRRIQNLEPDDVQPKRDEWMSRSVGHINDDMLNEEYKKAMRISLQKNRTLNRFA